MDHDDSQLSRNRAALGQLERALQRLEWAVARKNGDLFLSNELKASREDFARLDRTAAEVDGRLGAVIDRLRDVLAE